VVNPIGETTPRRRGSWSSSGSTPTRRPTPPPRSTRRASPSVRCECRPTAACLPGCWPGRRPGPRGPGQSKAPEVSVGSWPNNSSPPASTSSMSRPRWRRELGCCRAATAARPTALTPPVSPPSRCTVNGQDDLPVGGHGLSPRTVVMGSLGTATRIPRGRPGGSAGYLGSGVTPLPLRASARRMLSPSVTRTWA
jgi:hypothetical protein